ncbi:MAG: 50S ribosomal protein L18 [Mycoplasma sp.]|nr:50S ribosomal protein L18 [Mycoplasma sp.]
MAQINRKLARKLKHIRTKKNILGDDKRPRLVIYKSLQNFEAQLIDDIKHHTICYVSTKQIPELKYGGNINAAKLAGERMASLIKDLKIERIVFDRSGYIYHGRVKAFGEALKQGGVKL